MKRNFRKPLIIAGPKTLLRHPKCVSKLEDLSDVTHFKRILHYTNPELLKTAKNLVICSGKYVYDIDSLAQSNKVTDLSIVTIEELYPFPE
jgi:2-oxoglutarate dehydrogenase complex dehydrogenase (E1) component-like enzyme